MKTSHNEVHYNKSMDAYLTHRTRLGMNNNLIEAPNLWVNKITEEDSNYREQRACEYADWLTYVGVIPYYRKRTVVGFAVPLIHGRAKNKVFEFSKCGGVKEALLAATDYEYNYTSNECASLGIDINNLNPIEYNEDLHLTYDVYMPKEPFKQLVDENKTLEERVNMLEKDNEKLKNIIIEMSKVLDKFDK